MPSFDEEGIPQLKENKTKKLSAEKNE